MARLHSLRFNQEQGIAVTMAPLSVRQLDWLPAVENLGEGVFLELNRERLQAWEDLDIVQRRSGVLLKAYSDWRQARRLPAIRDQRPRLILLHTLAHLLSGNIVLRAAKRRRFVNELVGLALGRFFVEQEIGCDRVRKKGSGTVCAEHPSGRSGKRYPTPFSES